VPFCQVHCPLQNNIPDWLKLTAEGRMEEAYEVASATNTFPEICGRICPQDRLCEGNCVIEQAGHGTVTIGAVERYISDTAFELGWVRPIRPLRELDLSVAVIGAGPAGLSAGAELRKRGYQVDIYDRYDRVAGPADRSADLTLGVVHAPYRRVLDAIFWISRTGSPWRDLPAEAGKWSSVYRQFLRWTRSGIWDVLLEALAESRAAPDSLQMIDSTIVRAHQHAAGGRGGLVATLWAVRAVASRPKFMSGRTRKALASASP